MERMILEIGELELANIVGVREKGKGKIKNDI